MIDCEVTLTIDGDESDHFCRGFVEVGPFGATRDGDIDVMVNGTWWPLDSLNVDAGDEERIEEAICDLANEDDSCDPDEYDGDR